MYFILCICEGLGSTRFCIPFPYYIYYFILYCLICQHFFRFI
nr:MAG TPA: hypothetical protein [Caudoviricetes sp.]